MSIVTAPSDRAFGRNSFRADCQCFDPRKRARRVHRQVELWAGPGSAGNGKPHNLGGEMLKSAASRDVRHMPDRGSVAAMLDVITAHVAFMVMDLQVPLQEISMTRSALWASPP
jgi:hypothetical protein